ncbi:hypothetical protein AC1031_014432 [Aphanomyces cochlioides]|nr:hypothetical protein AC1031_014432 [Aphanomyces cochlioides]
MATAAPPAINLAKDNPAKLDQNANPAKAPAGELADVDMAPDGTAKNAPTPQPTAKAKEPGQTQTGSKDSTSTSSHSDKIQKTQKKYAQMYSKNNTNPQPDENNAPQGNADTTPPNSTNNPTHEPNTNAQAKAPAEQATANTNPWQSGSSLADKLSKRLSKKKPRTMRTVLPNEEDTQRLFELAKAARTDKAKRLEHFEFIKAVNLKLGWDMACDTPLIIPVPEDLRATRLEVAECINTEQTDPIVLEMIRQRKVGKVHFQQYRRRVVLWLKDEGT